MAYRIEFTRPARKAFLALPSDVQNLLEKKIDRLGTKPRPPGTEKLSGGENLYRIRSGDYRVIYQIQDKVLLILVIRCHVKRFT